FVVCSFTLCCGARRASPSFPTRPSSDLKHYVYVWADGVPFNIRLEEGRQCILVLMGATTDGKKELIALPVAVREGDQLLLAVGGDRQSTRLNSSHVESSYAVCCLKTKKV